jgi:hypothetical protein
MNAEDMLLALDPIGTAVDPETPTRDLEAASAKTSRREAAIAAASADALEPLLIEFAATVSLPVRRPHKSCCPPISRNKRRTACVRNQSSSRAQDLTSHTGAKPYANCCFGCGDAAHYLRTDALGGAVLFIRVPELIEIWRP